MCKEKDWRDIDSDFVDRQDNSWSNDDNFKDLDDDNDDD